MSTEETTVIALDPIEINALYQEPKKLDTLIEELSAKALAIVPDTATAKGRAQIKSTAYAITQLKTKAAGVGKERIAELRSKYESDTAATRDAVRVIEEKLTDLAKRVREPLTRWEEEQKAIAERAAQRLKDIEHLGNPTDEFGRPLDMEALQIKSGKLEEYSPETHDENEAIIAGKQRIAEAITAETKRIEEREELQRLRKQQEEQAALNALLSEINSTSGLNEDGLFESPDVIRERIKRLMDMHIDNPAAEAVRRERLYLLEAQRKEAVSMQEVQREQQRAHQFHEIVERFREYLNDAEVSASPDEIKSRKDHFEHSASAKTDTEKLQLNAVLARADKAIEDAMGRERKKAFAAKIDFALSALSNDKLAATEAALAALDELTPSGEDQSQAIADARIKIENHAQKIRDRIAEEQAAREKQIADNIRKEIEEKEAAAREAQAAREADEKHRKNINNEVITDLISVGISHEQAADIVDAIASGRVRNTVINY